MDEVCLVMPAASEYLRTARLVAADAATRAGLDCEEIEDFRIAIDELCHSTMAATDHHISLTFVIVADGVVAHGTSRSRAASVAPRLSTLSFAILTSVCDHFEFDDADGLICFMLVKHAKRAMAARS
jgi:hypothetical protein